MKGWKCASYSVQFEESHPSPSNCSTPRTEARTDYKYRYRILELSAFPNPCASQSMSWPASNHMKMRKDPSRALSRTSLFPRACSVIEKPLLLLVCKHESCVWRLKMKIHEQNLKLLWSCSRLLMGNPRKGSAEVVLELPQTKWVLMGRKVLYQEGSWAFQL